MRRGGWQHRTSPPGKSGKPGSLNNSNQRLRRQLWKVDDIDAGVSIWSLHPDTEQQRLRVVGGRRRRRVDARVER